MHIHCFEAGDWSGDGHSITEVVWFKSDLTKEEVVAALEEGVVALGLTPHSAGSFGAKSLPFCEAYEDWKIPKTVVEALGVEYTDDEETQNQDYLRVGTGYPDDEWNLEDGRINWYELHAAVIKSVRQNSTIQWYKPEAIHRIGGYGLFFT